LPNTGSTWHLNCGVGRLGYAHPNQFSREFKKRWGYSPTGKKQPTVTENEETAQFVP